jgi:hypothetical protein
MSTIVQTPLVKRVNFRLIAFLLLVSALPLCAVYAIINYQLHGGIEQGDGFAKVDLQALGNFPFDQGSGSMKDIPSRWRNLDGKRVQLIGFVYAPQQAGGQISEFQLVYNVTKCCFSGPPQVQESVFGFVARGKQIQFSEFCKVTGTLHVKVEQDGGKVVSVYTLDVDKAEPLG